MRFFMMFFLLTFNFVVQAQDKNFIDVPYVETTASADTLIVPDRIYFNIVISEKDAKGDMTLEGLQAKMEETLRKLGIDTKQDLELADLVSNFRRNFLKGQDISRTKLYYLVVKDATMAGNVIIALESINISNITLEKLEYSKAPQLMLILKGKAIKKSRQYAETMAHELNQTVGSAIFISDRVEKDPHQSVQGRNNEMLMGGTYVFTAAGKYSEPDMRFKKLRFETTVQVRYKLN